MHLRRLDLCWLATLVHYASAVTLLQVIQNYPDLSILNTYINNSTNITSLLSNANNFTFLAPNNKAIDSFLNNNPSVLTEGLLQATIQYSLLRGGYPKLSFTNTPQFVTSNLVNGSYTNVTAGQAVELVLDSNGTPQAVTGNKSVSTPATTDIVCTGGVVHIMDEVLSVPVPAVSQFTASGLEYFISILNNEGYLNTDNVGYVDAVLAQPNITYLIPNSAAALANATALAANVSSDEMKAVFEYHIVPGVVAYSTALTNGTSLKTAQGGNVTITVQDGDVYVNSAKVIASDYIVANGVVHVLDNLLDRNDTSPPPKPTASSTASSSSVSSPTSAGIPTANASADAKASSHSPTSKSLSTGAIIGIAVGASAGGLLALAALIFWFCHRRRSGEQNRNSGVWSDQSTQGGANNEKASAAYSPGRPQRPKVMTQENELGTVTSIAGGQYGDGDDRFVTNLEPRKDAPQIPYRSPDRLVQGQEFF
ncbi:Fasciclin-like arabinogalactan protein [Lachnellula subtilissima]|uniref:Fasciclin-like arabinogalactan protein n=1 Tax=Lachnellula subtilissima TaxID=602034 RepID=A0A8H8UBX5_9HELO|nr:Fasciclin-like arabinogalactan protein [Lachnellula subtilissima]